MVRFGISTTIIIYLILKSQINHDTTAESLRSCVEVTSFHALTHRIVSMNNMILSTSKGHTWFRNRIVYLM